MGGAAYSLPASEEATYKSAAFLIALLYAAALAMLPLDVFKDRLNYLTYADQSDIILLRYWNDGLLSFLSNEPLWLATNILLRKILPPELVVRAIIFFSSFTVSWVAISRYSREVIWILLFLLLVQFIKNYIIHLRQGYAIAIFFLGWFAFRSRARWFFIGASPFIHSSFAFVILIMLSIHIFRLMRMDAYICVLLAGLSGLIVGASLPYIASVLGARQAGQYDFVSTDVSGLGFLYWSSVLILFLLSGSKFARNHVFSLSLIAFYLATYFQIEVTARIFESGLLLVLLSGLSLTGWRRNLFTSSMILYATLQYYQRIGLPYLGWGA